MVIDSRCYNYLPLNREGQFIKSRVQALFTAHVALIAAHLNAEVILVVTV